MFVCISLHFYFTKSSSSASCCVVAMGTSYMLTKYGTARVRLITTKTCEKLEEPKDKLRFNLQKNPYE